MVVEPRARPVPPSPPTAMAPGAPPAALAGIHEAQAGLVVGGTFEWSFEPFAHQPLARRRDRGLSGCDLVNWCGWFCRNQTENDKENQIDDWHKEQQAKSERQTCRAKTAESQ